MRLWSLIPLWCHPSTQVLSRCVVPLLHVRMFNHQVSMAESCTLACQPVLCKRARPWLP
jgi:hypothetical protein